LPVFQHELPEQRQQKSHKLQRTDSFIVQEGAEVEAPTAAPPRLSPLCCCCALISQQPWLLILQLWLLVRYALSTKQHHDAVSALQAWTPAIK
jgi:hypothetical protein